MSQSSVEAPASEIIDRLKVRYRVGSDSDLALRLLVSRSTIANWRNRNRVPARYARIAKGETVPEVWGGAYGEWPEVERVAMRLALMRLIRDFPHVGETYEGFILGSLEAATRLQEYHEQATLDLSKAMDDRDSADAHAVAQLLALEEFSKQK